MMKTFIANIVVSAFAVYLVLVYLQWLPYNATTSMLVFCLSYFLLWLLSFFYDKAHFRKAPALLGLFFFFVKELIIANLKLAYDILTPQYIMQPTVIALPLSAKTDFEIMLLSNLISLTPGTLSLDVTEDKQYLYIHALYVKAGDTEKLKSELKEGFERRILAITR